MKITVEPFQQAERRLTRTATKASGRHQYYKLDPNSGPKPFFPPTILRGKIKISFFNQGVASLLQKIKNKQTGRVEKLKLNKIPFFKK